MGNCHGRIKTKHLQLESLGNCWERPISTLCGPVLEKPLAFLSPAANFPWAEPNARPVSQFRQELLAFVSIKIDVKKV